MKFKTMLRFLLCFLIIGSLFISSETFADVNANAFFSSSVSNSYKNTVDAEVDVLVHIQGLIMTAGMLLAVVVVLIYGIQWAMATSAKRQELKAGMWPLAIGVILLVLGPRLAVSIHDALLNDSASVTGHVNKIGGTVINTVQTIGYIVAVVMVLYVGIQWLVGTPNKRQELKSRMINLIIGAVLIAGGVTILGWISDVATKDMAYNITDIYRT